LLNAAGAANSGKPTNKNQYYCTSSGKNFPLRGYDGDSTGAQNATIVQGKDDTVHGGGAFGNVPINVTVDYAVTNNIMAGLRFAFVANGYSGSAAKNDGVGFTVPFRAEARGTYVIGKDAIAVGGLKPYIYLGAGFGAVNAPVGVTVAVCPNGMPASTCTSPPSTQQATAWKIAGPGFIAAGGGIRYGFGGGTDGASRFALTAGIRLEGAIGEGFLFVPGIPEVGFQAGFL
jgi:hypothetical protein